MVCVLGPGTTFKYNNACHCYKWRHFPYEKGSTIPCCCILSKGEVLKEVPFWWTEDGKAWENATEFLHTQSEEELKKHLTVWSASQWALSPLKKQKQKLLNKFKEISHLLAKWKKMLHQSLVCFWADFPCWKCH